MDNDLLYKFLKGSCNPNGLTIKQCIEADDYQLEHQHDFIQWCFPLDEPSSVYPEFPYITEDSQIEKILEDEDCIANIRKMSQRMLKFYKDNPIRSSLDHNCLRMTRILRFLRMFKQEELHAEFSNLAYKFNDLYGGVFGIDKVTLNYWQEASQYKSI